jgi:hypothetical protein
MTEGSSQAKRRLGREIAIVLVVKAIILATIYVAFFGPDQRPVIDAKAVENRLFEAAPAVNHGRGGNV